jgi:hypothetical protein
MDLALGYHGGSNVIGREYFVQQAAILFQFAKVTKDPKISAALLEKALISKPKWTRQCRQSTQVLRLRTLSPRHE